MKAEQLELLLSLATKTENPLEIDTLRQQLIDTVRYLIVHQFDKLIEILYRIDIDEKKLKTHLMDQSADAAVIIADLIIKRQQEKMETKRFFSGDKDISEEEKW